MLAAAFSFFDQVVDAEQIDEIVNSQLFTHHSKVTEVEYSNDARIAGRERLREALAVPLAEVRKWVAPFVEQLELPHKLVKPLLGESPALMA